MKGSCVFWIPTIYHQELHPWQGHSVIDEEISDKVGCKCLLSLELAQTQDISVKLKIEDHTELEFVLTKKDAHHNGLFVYKFETDDAHFDIVELALKNPIYHFIKGFYHRHQYHSDDCDSILDAYVLRCDNDISVDTPDNEPLVFYLKQYEQRFKAFAEQLDNDATYLKSIQNDPRYRCILYREKYEQFNQRCVNILGEVIYYNTLLNSKYNHSCRLGRPDSACKHDLYKSALNTANSIARIRLIAEEVNNICQGRRANATLKNIEMANAVLAKLTDTTNSIESMTSSSLQLQKKVDKALVKGDRWAKLSFGLGILSLILSCYSIYLARPKVPERIGMNTKTVIESTNCESPGDINSQGHASEPNLFIKGDGDSTGHEIQTDSLPLKQHSLSSEIHKDVK